jgi:hypothetical protein
MAQAARMQPVIMFLKNEFEAAIVIQISRRNTAVRISGGHFRVFLSGRLPPVQVAVGSFT